MFAGGCDNCTDGSGLQIPYRITGSGNGTLFTSCPSMRIGFTNATTSTNIVFSTPSTAGAGVSINLSATLTGPGALSGKSIKFRDDTDNVDIGSFITNASGIAQIAYVVPLSASVATHTFRAIFAGDVEYISSETSNSINITSGVIQLWASNTEAIWNSSYYYYDPYNTYDKDSRAQFIVSASDLTTAGLAAGSNINAIYLKTYEKPGRDLSSFRIKAKLILPTVIQTTSWEGGWTELFGPATINVNTTPVDMSLTTPGSWKRYEFSPNFQWNGTSNIMFDISRDDNTYTSGGDMYVRTGVGTNRMFAGGCDNCTDGSGLQIPYRITGSGNGTLFTSCPSMRIGFTNP